MGWTISGCALGQRLSGQGQRYGESGTLTGLACEGDLAIVESHNLGDIVESDAESFHVVDVAGGDAVEFLENMFLVFLGNADAMVGDLDDGETIVGMGGDVNLRIVGGVFDGVVY